MRPKENERFVRVGSSYVWILLGIIFVLPAVVSLLGSLIVYRELGIFPYLYIICLFVVGLFVLMSVAWGDFSRRLMKKAKRSVRDLTYNFDRSFESRGGALYIDVNQGMIAFISAYNPFEVQLFSAKRIHHIKSVASTTRGFRFEFYLDDKKISMPTLITNKVISAKSAEGMEATAKADTYVQLLEAAKANAV